MNNNKLLHPQRHYTRRFNLFNPHTYPVLVLLLALFLNGRTEVQKFEAMCPNKLQLVNGRAKTQKVLSYAITI